MEFYFQASKPLGVLILLRYIVLSQRTTILHLLSSPFSQHLLDHSSLADLRTFLYGDHSMHCLHLWREEYLIHTRHKANKIPYCQASEQFPQTTEKFVGEN